VFSVPLTAAQLALYMEKPITSIEAEFRNIATSTVRIDELPAGVETKNRYANVLPVPETRVHIRVQDNQPMDTIEQYINANYIKVRALHISQPFSRERIKPFFWNE
jgi:protein tyrosine phosphatase